jgi:Flp pilus assembly protein protease CpaA
MELSVASDALALTIVTAGTGLAAVIDLRTRRIPNALTGALAVLGVGIAAAKLGPVGLGGALLGCALGLAFMLPGHVFGATGAGDVKLFAAAGALLAHTLGTTARIISDRTASVSAIESPEADNRFAYAPAIAVGVVMAVLL